MQNARPWYASWPTHVPKELGVEPKPLYSLLDDGARSNPKNVCLVYYGTRLTYEQVRELSSRFASALLSRGMKKGDRVAIYMPNAPQFVISYFGTLMAGGVSVPCSPLYRERELEYQLLDSGARFIVAANDVVKENDLFAPFEASRTRVPIELVITASLTDYLPGLKRRLASLAGIKNKRRKSTVTFRELVAAAAPLSAPAAIDPAHDLAVLQYTGGTTGTSKGAMLSHANLYLDAIMTSYLLPRTAREVSLAVLPLFHIYGMTAAMNAALYRKWEIVLLPRFDVEMVMKTIQDEKVTVFCGVPTMYIAIMNHPKVREFNLRSIRACISGGAALPLAVRNGFMELTGSQLVEGYGLSEASPVTHCNPIGGGPNAPSKEGSIGIPISDTDAAIVDVNEPDKFLPPEEVGELAVKGPQVMLGYWMKPDETELVLRYGWLLTGDIAKMDRDGYFYIVDRKKDMIDVGGLKVYPREVEEVLFTHPDVKEAAVVGDPDAYWGEVVKAFIVPKAESKGKISEQEIIDYCKQRIAKFKVPSTVVFVDELPKTLVGKVLRRALREQARQRNTPDS